MSNIKKGALQKRRINAILALLKREGFNNAIQLDGVVGPEAETAITALKATLTPPQVNNLLIAVLKLAGFNSRRLDTDGTFGKEVDKALDQFLALKPQTREEITE